MGTKVEIGVKAVINKKVLRNKLKQHREKFCKEGERASFQNLWNYIRNKYDISMAYSSISHYMGKNPTEWKLTYAAIVAIELETSMSDLFIMQKVGKDGSLEYDTINSGVDTKEAGLKYGTYDPRSLGASKLRQA